MKKHFIGLKTIVTIAALLFLNLDLGAQCITPLEQGNWFNRDAATSGITHLTVDFVCQDQIVNGQPYPPGPPFYVNLWGKCVPTDCDWGRVGANPVTLSGTHWLYAVYNQGFATRYVYMKPSQLYPGNLYVWIYSDFTSPTRQDYSAKYWFHH